MPTRPEMLLWFTVIQTQDIPVREMGSVNSPVLGLRMLGFNLFVALLEPPLKVLLRSFARITE
ncbi:unnamed protein product [Rhizoctonia solani]|nr:unnamed protein product [Rhizoctonia solani]